MATGERAFQVYRTWVQQWQAARRAELRAELLREIERVRLQREDPRFRQALARHRAAVLSASRRVSGSLGEGRRRRRLRLLRPAVCRCCMVQRGRSSSVQEANCEEPITYEDMVLEA